jgi:hypothetical protein
MKYGNYMCEETGEMFVLDIRVLNSVPQGKLTVSCQSILSIYYKYYEQY